VVAAAAARDVSRAQAFAAKHGIARVYDSHEALTADPDLDAVYNPLPNGLHGRWTRAALNVDKHVLCEKPFTANAAEAREIAELAATGRCDRKHDRRRRELSRCRPAPPQADLNANPLAQ
jgi:predicted dehydrogenase